MIRAIFKFFESQLTFDTNKVAIIALKDTSLVSSDLGKGMYGLKATSTLSLRREYTEKESRNRSRSILRSEGLLMHGMSHKSASNKREETQTYKFWRSNEVFVYAFTHKLNTCETNSEACLCPCRGCDAKWPNLVDELTVKVYGQCLLIQ